jgi:hypothetical protein
MISSINVVTLPRTCFAVVPDDYDCHESDLKINKLIHDSQKYADLNGNMIDVPVESIVTDKTKTLYVNLAVRKYLMTDAKLLSGQVQALSCDYLIFTAQDTEDYCLQKVKDVIGLAFWDEYAVATKEALQNALDFDLISEDDYVQMTYKHPNRTSWKESKTQWNVGSNHNVNFILQATGMMIPSNKKVIELQEVLNYSKNRGITQEESNKIKMLLQAKDSEKVALTLLNTINPNNSFVELMCLINHMDDNIRRNNPNVPVLPLLKGAYNVDTGIKRKSDRIVKEYEKKFGYASNEVLERIADNYYHPTVETSSVFDFKLKIKRK